MKALSIKEPWAGLIVEGKKTIELRSWRTHYRGSVLVNRSGKNGGIVGTMEIVDVIKIESLDQYRALRDQHHAPDEFYQEKLFGWILENVKPVEFISCKGRLGLWEPPDDILNKLA